MSDRVLRVVKQRCYCNSGSRTHSCDDAHHDHPNRNSKIEKKMPKLKSCFEVDAEISDQDQSTGSADTSYIFQAPTTPFELPHVFNEILQYMPIKDWKNCRLVNSAWLAACSTNPRPVTNFRLVIRDTQRLKELINRKSEWGLNPIPVVFEDVKLPVGVPLNNSYLLSFFETFGRHIKRLTVPDGWSINGLRVILFDRCANLEELHLKGRVPRETDRIMCPEGAGTSRPLPKLKKLIFEIFNAHVDLFQNAEIFPPGFFNNGTNPLVKWLISDLLTLAPNLEWVQCPTRRDLKQDSFLSTKLAHIYGITPTDVESSFNRVNQFLAQKLFSFAHDCNPKINGLQLYLRLNARGMDKLAAKGYPLQTIDLHVRTVDKQGLMDLLPQLGSTLKNLRLTVDNKFNFDFPCEFLTELRTLNLEDYAGDLQFIRDIPKLTSLTLGYFNSNVFIKKHVFPPIHSTLKSVTLENLLLPEQQARCIKRLSTVFPNVVKFQVNNVNDKDLLRIYDCLPHLEELHMDCNNVSNAGITGFTESDTEAILDNGYEQNNFDDYEKLRRLQYIGDLKHLKSLTLSGQVSLISARFATGRMVNTLQSLFILHGLCSLRNLRVLTLHDATISATEMKQLLRTLTLSRLELVDCRIDAAVLGWVQKKLRSTALEFVNRKTDYNNVM